MFSAGTKLGHYEIRSQLGAGGMGDVYLAQDAKLDRKVALKILPAEVASNQESGCARIQVCTWCKPAGAGTAGALW